MITQNTNRIDRDFLLLNPPLLVERSNIDLPLGPIDQIYSQFERRTFNLYKEILMGVVDGGSDLIRLPFRAIHGAGCGVIEAIKFVYHKTM